MKKLALFVAVVCLISCFGMNAHAQTTTSGFVGLSVGSTNGARSGQPGMNQMCLNKFVNSHMCTADEFFGTAGLSANQTPVQLWVQPVPHNCVFDSAQGETTCRETGFLRDTLIGEFIHHVQRVDLGDRNRHLRTVH